MKVRITYLSANNSYTEICEGRYEDIGAWDASVNDGKSPAFGLVECLLQSDNCPPAFLGSCIRDKISKVIIENISACKNMPCGKNDGKGSCLMPDGETFYACPGRERSPEIKMLDLSEKTIEIAVRHDKKVLWVNTEDGCVLRACKIKQLRMDVR